MSTVDLQSGIDALISALPDYERAGMYWDGDTDELFFSAGIQRQLSRNNAVELRLNLARIAVTVVGDRLEISAVSADGDDAQTIIDQLAEANDFDIELPNLFTKALVYGDAYLVADGDPEDGIEIFYNGPTTCRVIYDPENPRRKLFAVKRWQIANPAGKGQVWRANVYYPDHIERYVTSKATNGTKASQFVPFTSDAADDDDHVIPNVYGFIPVWHFRTARPYGESELKQGMGAQDILNKIALAHTAAIDYQSWPQRYVMAAQGQDSSEIDDFDADIFHDAQDPEATIQGPGLYQRRNVLPHSGLTADPGGVWTLPNGTQVGQFQAADSKNFIDSLAEYSALMAQTTNTPLHYLNTTNDAPSGESLRVAEAPLVKKVRARAMSFGGTLADCLTDLLSLFGVKAKITVHWNSFESSDTLDTWQIVQAKLNAGMPLYDAFTQAGITPDALEAMGISRDSGLSLKDRAELMNLVGRGATGFSAAVSAGILTPEEAGAAFLSFFTDDTNDAGHAA